MKKNSRTTRTSKPARRAVKAEVRDLKPRSSVNGGAFVRKVDKASPDIS
jgi:hypothetical protein